jgi:superfamily II DNA or RNA helicase
MKDNSLRNYQQQAKGQIFSQWNDADNILYQMPTGTGKTRLFTSIIRDINVWGLRNGHRQRILIIAHRSELIEQIDRSLNKYHIPHGVIAGIFKEKRDLTQPVQVASIQTITHGSNEHIARHLDVNFIIIDEAHHAVARSYTKLWQLYPEAKKLGVTATPWRMNNEGFRTSFDAFIPSMSIKEFLKQGWLAPYKYYSIPLNSSIKKSINAIDEYDIEGDYKVSALERTMDNDHIRAQLLDSYQKLASGKKGIIYSISREHSEHICQQYQSVGVRIVAIDSMTPARKREMLVNDFKAGMIDIIVNVDIFSEGFDCPDIEFIQLARPTKSLVKYIQQVGRGLRKNGSKECIILDNVGMYTTFGLPDEDRNWEEFFAGEEKVCKSSNNGGQLRQIYNIQREVDMSEGNEEMVLVQEAQKSEEVTVTSATNNRINDEVENSFEDSILRHFSIKSKTFAKGKFVVEENEDGYFLCNVRNGRKNFLVKCASHQTGSIVLRKTDSAYMIVRLVPRTKGDEEKESIIGFLYQEGRLLRFTSLDKTIKDKNVSI